MTFTDAAVGTLIVENSQDWFGNQNLGAFSVRVDETQAAVVLPRQQVTLMCHSGSHVVRVRRWWFRSRPLVLQVQAGETIQLAADVVRQGTLLTRVLTTTFRPSRALNLEVAGPASTES
jgi:hypothetical protein